MCTEASFEYVVYIIVCDAARKVISREVYYVWAKTTFYFKWLNKLVLGHAQRNHEGRGIATRLLQKSLYNLTTHTVNLSV